MPVMEQAQIVVPSVKFPGFGVSDFIPAPLGHVGEKERSWERVLLPPVPLQHVDLLIIFPPPASEIWVTSAMIQIDLPTADEIGGADLGPLSRAPVNSAGDVFVGSHVQWPSEEL